MAKMTKLFTYGDDGVFETGMYVLQDGVRVALVDMDAALEGVRRAETRAHQGPSLEQAQAAGASGAAERWHHGDGDERSADGLGVGA